MKPSFRQTLVAATLLGLAALSSARASFHLWQIDEVYSDASGTVQFIELTVTSDGENFLSGRTLASAGHTFTFPSNLPAKTANHHLLLATPGYIALAGVPAADFNLGVNNFFDTSGDTLNYANVNTLTFTSGQLPLDGTNSLNRAFNPPTPTTFSVAAKSPTNFSANGSTTPGAPTLKITGPRQLTTRQAKITIKGTTTGAVARVNYRIGSGPTRHARGTANWSFIAVLKPGKNLITVTAQGAAGNSAPAKITVTRK